ncbi:PspC domain-containing protein [Listeria fleischmannii]|uniref:PspC domain-containing protein n=1 Tax=Listeria fleischmannii FSL S10-1203 TaxID=1265822 RepID=W7DQK8_9LIST|nr:PspC domain-containing protein [Listeria fleischmannii]EUJ64797.1 PspC domain-containing protein [Listeria fleischmannii FSL S10-1203]
MDKKLRRSRVDRKIGGVFGGISEYTGVDATILRLIFIVVAIFTMKTGIAIIAYIIALFVIPSENMTNEEVLDHHRKRVDEKRRRMEARKNRQYERIDRHQEAHMKHKMQHERARAQHAERNHPGKTRPRPSREFSFDATTFRGLKVQVATGDVTLRVWEKEDLKVRVGLAVHEKARSIRQLSEDKLWDYFFSQTMLEITPEQFIFESKNDVLKTDIVLTVPKRLYEQMKIQLLNGNLKFDDVAAEDTILKVHHGDVRSTGASGKFLSTEVLDGEIFFRRVNVENIDLSTQKGDVAVSGNLLTTVAKTAKGDVDYIVYNDTATAADLKAPNGDIRIQIPASWNVDGTLGTRREKIYFDLKNAKVWDNSNQTFVFTQNAEEISTGTIQASVNTGIIKVTELEETQEEVK